MKPVTLRTGGSNRISSEQVRIYLADHPEFFAKHEELLEILVVPHPSGSAVSLLEKQLSIYRKNNERLQQELCNLVQIARDNEQLLRKMHQLTLSLMDAVDLESTIGMLQSVLLDQFKADFVSIRLFQDNGASTRAELFVPNQDARLDSFRKIVDSRHPKCGRPASKQAAFLFGDNADRVRSCAIIPFVAAEVIGLLGIGSSDDERFSPGQGHLFLSRIGEMLGVRLSSMLANATNRGATCHPG